MKDGEWRDSREVIECEIWRWKDTEGKRERREAQIFLQLECSAFKMKWEMRAGRERSHSSSSSCLDHVLSLPVLPWGAPMSYPVLLQLPEIALKSTGWSLPAVYYRMNEHCLLVSRRLSLHAVNISGANILAYCMSRANILAYCTSCANILAYCVSGANILAYCLSGANILAYCAAGDNNYHALCLPVPSIAALASSYLLLYMSIAWIVSCQRTMHTVYQALTS